MSKKTIPQKASATSGEIVWYSVNMLKARLLIVMACIVCYGNTVFNDFSFDDDLVFTNNAYVQQGIAGIPDILTHHYISRGNKSADYRPIAGISFAIEKQFFGNNAPVGHIINIALFIICCLIVFEVLCRLLLLGSFPTGLALVIMLFYIAHPAHTEVVSSIKNRDEILSLLFSFLALGFALKYFGSKEFKLKDAILSLVFLLLSFLSKITSMPVIAIIVLLGLFTTHRDKRKIIYRFAAAMVVVVFIALNFVLHNIKRENHYFENPLSASPDISIHLGTSLETLLFYFKFLLIPYPFSFYYGYNTLPMLPLSDIQAVFALLLYAGILGYGLILFSRKDVLGFFILAYLLSIILYGNLVPVYPGIVAERVLFSPSLWFTAAMAILLYRVGGFAVVKSKTSFSKNAITALAIIIFSVYTWLTIQRNFQWKNTLTLMSADIGHLENSTLANYFYGSVLQETGEKMNDTSRMGYLVKAKQYYRESLAVSPDYSEPYFKLGMIYEYDENRSDSAFNCFQRAYRLDTTPTPVRFQLAKLYMFKGNFKEANPLFGRLYQEIPTDTSTLFFYAQSLFFGGDTAKAVKVNNQLLALAPQIYQPYLNRGMFNKSSGNMPAAEPDLQRSLQLGCTEPVVINSLLNYYTETGQTDKANVLQKYQRRKP